MKSISCHHYFGSTSTFKRMQPFTKPGFIYYIYNVCFFQDFPMKFLINEKEFPTNASLLVICIIDNTFWNFHKKMNFLPLKINLQKLEFISETK